MLTNKRPLCKIESNMDTNLFQNLLLNETVLQKRVFFQALFSLLFLFSPNIEHIMHDVIHPLSHYDKFAYND